MCKELRSWNSVDNKMGIIQTICQKLGEKNNALYAVVTVAAFKSISRPIFTLLDKKKDPESKKYAALRESATEVIAIPAYIAVAKASERLAPIFHSKDAKGAHLETTKTALGFIGVCFAGAVIIPALCNLVMPLIFKNDKKNPNNNLIAQETLTPYDKVPTKTFQNNKSYNKQINYSGGMKI